MPSKVITAPASEPISLEAAKNHLKVDYDTDDTLISGLITAAREYAEDYTNLKLITQTVEEVFPCFPPLEGAVHHDAITLTFSPLQSVSSISYLNTSGASTPLAESEYIDHTHMKPPLITPEVDKEWPDTYDQPDAVKVTYVVGFGAADDIPETIISAMLLMIGYWYENRADSVRRQPTQAEHLLKQQKILTF